MTNFKKGGRHSSAVRLSTLCHHLRIAPTASTGHNLAPWELSQLDAPPTTPLDIRLGLTSAEGIHHTLRWGVVSASAIASDWIKSLQDVPGAVLQAVWVRVCG
eukprot:SAG11_NODE_20827_length_437_cov_1.068047_1_plen_102_part_10